MHFEKSGLERLEKGGFAARATIRRQYVEEGDDVVVHFVPVVRQVEK